MTDGGRVHDEHPFATPVNERDPVRRFRGRLAAPVTVITAGDEDERVGLTVSSIVVADGEPSRVYFLIGSTTDLFYAMEETGRFVVHVCEQGHETIADVFAGLRPSPGGMFVELEVEQSPYGPVLLDMGTRAFCSYQGGDEETFSFVASGEIDHLDLSDLRDPLLYFRGEYRSIDEP